MLPPPKIRPPPKSETKAKADPLPPPTKQDLRSPEFTTPSGLAHGSGLSIPPTISLGKYNELVGQFNQLQEALVKVREQMDHYKNKPFLLSGSLSDNVEELKRANHIILELEKECSEIAESVGLDRDIIF